MAKQNLVDKIVNNKDDAHSSEEAELNKDAVGFLINPKGTKYTTVKAFKNHKCEINKVPYVLVKGEKYRVSEFASIVLTRAGIV